MNVQLNPQLPKKICKRTSLPLNLSKSHVNILRKQVNKRSSLLFNKAKSSAVVGKRTSLLVNVSPFETSANQKTPRKNTGKRTLTLNFSAESNQTTAPPPTVAPNMYCGSSTPAKKKQSRKGTTLAPIKQISAAICNTTNNIDKFRFISDNNLINAVIPITISSPTSKKRKEMTTSMNICSTNLAPVKIDATLVDALKPDVKNYKLIDAPRFNTARKLSTRKRRKKTM